jgi:hypothetical protein
MSAGKQVNLHSANGSCSRTWQSCAAGVPEPWLHWREPRLRPPNKGDTTPPAGACLAGGRYAGPDPHELRYYYRADGPQNTGDGVLTVLPERQSFRWAWAGTAPLLLPAIIGADAQTTQPVHVDDQPVLWRRDFVRFFGADFSAPTLPAVSIRHCFAGSRLIAWWLIDRMQSTP